jgi:hypothetical protein
MVGDSYHSASLRYRIHLERNCMQNLTRFANRWKWWKSAIAVAASLLLAGQAVAAPTSLLCTFTKNVSGGQRVWVYDPVARTVDGHRTGETVNITAGAYNRYFITATEIGFSTSTGVRHTISLVNGNYSAYGADGKLNWTGTCAPLKQ